ncbi:MAG TPA: sugar phosphate nucleotidyltransferase [Longimicrobiales bacterium]|nr:sugar phosphate nucleotidyltransferase [Longimicrobiales bacterium]
MKVIIPLAGKGTRLRPQTYHTPKPLLHVGGRPVMSYILDDLKGLGVEEIIFITGYLGDVIEAYVAEAYPEFRAHYVEQPVQNGTAGAVKLAEDFVDEDILIIFVDTLFDADLGLAKRLPEGEAGVIWAKEVEDYQRFGVIVKDADGFMKRIVEKPKDPISKLANIGLYYIRDWRLFYEGVNDTLEGPPGPSGEFYITDAFQYMIDHGAKIRVGEVEGWYDCGQLETLLETNRHLLETGRGRLPDGGQNVKVHEPVRVEEGVELEDVEIGPNVTVETGSVIRGSTLRDSILGAGVRIENARLHDSLIGDRAAVTGITGRLSVAAHSVVAGETAD